MAAFHVIGVNFQLRFGVDLRQPPEQQIIVGHLTVGFQRERRDVDQPVKHRPPLIADDGFVQLAAGAVADLMVEPVRLSQTSFFTGIASELRRRLLFSPPERVLVW